MTFFEAMNHIALKINLCTVKRIAAFSQPHQAFISFCIHSYLHGYSHLLINICLVTADTRCVSVHAFIYSFIYSINKYLLRAHSVPGRR
jgi:hypothetical protein